MIKQGALLIRAFRAFRREFQVLATTFAVLLILPIIAALALANAPIQAVSDAVAWINPTSHEVEYKDKSGTVHKLQAETAWPAKGYVSDEYGTHQEWRKNLGLGPHSGIDIASFDGKVNSPVTPFMAGAVFYVDKIDNGHCGKGVMLTHPHGITSLYCHLGKVVDYSQGAKVKPGDIIGYMGRSGTSTGPHVHLTIRVAGLLVDPRVFLVGEPPQ